MAAIQAIYSWTQHAYTVVNMRIMKSLVTESEESGRGDAANIGNAHELIYTHAVHGLSGEMIRRGTRGGCA